MLEDLDGAIDLVLDGGETADRTPSTVLDLTTQPARLLREGKIRRAELASVCGDRLGPALKGRVL